MKLNIVILSIIPVILIGLRILIIHILLNQVMIRMMKRKRRMNNIKVIIMRMKKKKRVGIDIATMMRWMKKHIIWKNRELNSKEKIRKRNIVKITMMMIMIRHLLIVRSLTMRSLKIIFRVFWLSRKFKNWREKSLIRLIMIRIFEGWLINYLKLIN